MRAFVFRTLSILCAVLAGVALHAERLNIDAVAAMLAAAIGFGLLAMGGRQ